MIFGLQFHPEMSREEAVKLVHWRAKRHPECKLVAGKIIADAVPVQALASRIFSNFLASST